MEIQNANEYRDMSFDCVTGIQLA